ncbi:MAG: hypothetical protein KJ607_03355, partial [Bacteroidetes bacterium]|nr:hypothetical protein [Bacteroidota bacterium]
MQRSIAQYIQGLTSAEIRIYLIFIILIITSLAYSSAIYNDFVNFDDSLYVYKNYDIQNFNWNGLKKMFTHQFYGHFHPLTMLSYSIQYYFSGLKPEAYHGFSFVVHLLTVILTFFVVRKISCNDYIAFLSSLLMGIHPMNTESVAWVAGRGNVLYGFFYLSAFLAYLNFSDQRKKRRYMYFLVLFLFVCSLLSKSSAVTFPVVLVLVDLYKDKKTVLFKLLEKIPFFILSVLFGIIAIYSAKALGSMNPVLGSYYTIYDRVFFAFAAVWFYLRYFFFPYPLSNMHIYLEKTDGYLPYW